MISIGRINDTGSGFLHQPFEEEAMPDITLLLTAAAVCMAGVMSPGPNFVAISHRAVSAARQEAIAMVFGVALVNTLWAAISLFGLGVLLSRFPTMFWTIRLLGSAYLAWFGFQLIRRATTPLVQVTDDAGQPSFQSALRDGIVTNLANPKSMAFYASVFSGVVPDDATADTLLLLVAMVGVISALWYGSVALAFSDARIANLYRRGRRFLESACGVFLIGFAFRQALTD